MIVPSKLPIVDCMNKVTTYVREHANNCLTNFETMLGRLLLVKTAQGCSLDNFTCMLGDENILATNDAELLEHKDNGDLYFCLISTTDKGEVITVVSAIKLIPDTGEVVDVSDLIIPLKEHMH